MLKSHPLRILLVGGILLFTSVYAVTPSKPIFADESLKSSVKELPIDSEDYCFEPNTRLNSKTSRFVEQYITDNSENLDNIKGKSKNTFLLIDNVFKKYKLPLQLKYLAVIESELNTQAVSKVGAVGTWQLMPQTARILGLKISETEDERKCIRKSTKAAAIYLRDLHTEFKDWLLVLAAYNCGPGPVYAAMKKSGSKNFWMLQKFLPAESRIHVHKFIATHQYFEGKNPATINAEMEFLAAR